MLLDSWNVGLRFQPFSTESWAVWLRQIIPHFISLCRKFLVNIMIYTSQDIYMVWKISTHASQLSLLHRPCSIHQKIHISYLNIHSFWLQPIWGLFKNPFVLINFNKLYDRYSLFAGADTTHNLIGRSPRKIGLGWVSAAGGSAAQAKIFLGIG